MDCTVKHSANGTEDNAFGFFFKNGAVFRRQRTLFAELFKLENITKKVPEIHKILESEFDLLKKTKMQNGKAWTVNFDKVNPLKINNHFSLLEQPF